VLPTTIITLICGGAISRGVFMIGLVRPLIEVASPQGGAASDLKAEVAPPSWEKADIAGEGKRILGACQPRKSPLSQDGAGGRKRES